MMSAWYIFEKSLPVSRKESLTESGDKPFGRNPKRNPEKNKEITTYVEKSPYKFREKSMQEPMKKSLKEFRKSKEFPKKSGEESLKEIRLPTWEIISKRENLKLAPPYRTTYWALRRTLEEITKKLAGRILKECLNLSQERFQKESRKLFLKEPHEGSLKNRWNLERKCCEKTMKKWDIPDRIQEEIP